MNEVGKNCNYFYSNNLVLLRTNKLLKFFIYIICLCLIQHKTQLTCKCCSFWTMTDWLIELHEIYRFWILIIASIKELVSEPLSTKNVIIHKVANIHYTHQIQVLIIFIQESSYCIVSYISFVKWYITNTFLTISFIV